MTAPSLWKLPRRWKSAEERANSHRRLKRASQNTLGFFTVSTGSAVIQPLTQNVNSNCRPWEIIIDAEQLFQILQYDRD